jgi:hypothetical protein
MIEALLTAGQRLAEALRGGFQNCPATRLATRNMQAA